MEPSDVVQRGVRISSQKVADGQRHSRWGRRGIVGRVHSARNKDRPREPVGLVQDESKTGHARSRDGGHVYNQLKQSLQVVRADVPRHVRSTAGRDRRTRENDIVVRSPKVHAGNFEAAYESRLLQMIHRHAPAIAAEPLASSVTQDKAAPGARSKRAESTRRIEQLT